ncbi:MAG: hypothetical protein AABX51_00480 [Nanoarchaeota archaeon]
MEYNFKIESTHVSTREDRTRFTTELSDYLMAEQIRHTTHPRSLLDGYRASVKGQSQASEFNITYGETATIIGKGKSSVNLKLSVKDHSLEGIAATNDLYINLTRFAMDFLDQGNSRA